MTEVGTVKASSCEDDLTSNRTMLFKMFGKRKIVDEDDFAFNYGACNVLSAMHDSWLKQIMCDLTIKTQDGDIKTHRLILSAFSDGLSSLFSSCKDKTSISVNTSVEVMAIILNFLYTCDIELNCRLIQDILDCAKELDLQVLRLVCSDYLKETADGNNFILHFSIAVNHCLDVRHDLKEITIEAFDHISSHPHFGMLPYDHFKFILKDKSLKTEAHTILETVAVWMEQDKTDRLQYLNDLTMSIPIFPGDVDKLNDSISRHDWLLADDRSKDTVLKLLENFEKLNPKSPSCFNPKTGDDIDKQRMNHK